MTVNDWFYFIFPLFLSCLIIFGMKPRFDKMDRELLKEKDE